MKANEAPEKLYFGLQGDTGILDTYSNRESENEIEYIKVDAFIEKAAEWLSDNLQTIVDVDSPSKHHVESIPVLGSITQTEFLSKFRKEIMFLLD